MNQDYSFKVAPVNAAGDGAWSDVEMGAPTTARAEVQNAYETVASLLVWDFAPGFWFKHTRSDGPYATCTQSGPYAYPLSGLSAGTKYTIKIYSAANCNDADEIASTTFTTSDLWANQISHKGAMLRISNWSGQWNFKSTEAGATCQERASYYWFPLSGLDANTSYTYNAYILEPSTNNKCGTQIGTVTFKTLNPTLTVSKEAATGATVTIGGIATGTAWYHKGAAHNCTRAGTYKSTESTDLTGLTANSSYTWKVYDDSTCTTAGELASATVIDAAAEARQAHRRRRRRQRQVDAYRVGRRRQRGHRQVEIQEEGRLERLGCGLDRHQQHVEEPQPHLHGPDRRHRVSVQGDCRERLGRQRGVRRLGQGGAASTKR